MKRYLIAAAIIVILAGAWFASRPDDAPSEETVAADRPVPVSVRTVAASRHLNREASFPGTVSAQAEAQIESGVSGTVVWSPYGLGSGIAAGAVIAMVSETDSSAPIVEGIRSADLFSAATALRSAKERYDQAKRDYDSDRSSSNRTARDIARNDTEAAEADYRSLLDRYVIRSPIGGTITSAAASQGDLVSPGSPIFTVSRGDNVVRFHVTAEERALIHPETHVRIALSSDAGAEISVTRVSTAADPESRRFLVEATGDALAEIPAGSIVTVSVPISEAAPTGTFFVPLPALSQGDGTSIFVRDGDSARRVPVRIVRVTGEAALVNADLPDETGIIIDGAKRLDDGSVISVNEDMPS